MTSTWHVWDREYPEDAVAIVAARSREEALVAGAIALGMWAEEEHLCDARPCDASCSCRGGK